MDNLTSDYNFILFNNQAYRNYILNKNINKNHMETLVVSKDLFLIFEYSTLALVYIIGDIL